MADTDDMIIRLQDKLEASYKRIAELEAALRELLGQMQQGAYVHMSEHSPSAKDAIAKAEAVLGWKPGASYCKE